MSRHQVRRILSLRITLTLHAEVFGVASLRGLHAIDAIGWIVIAPMLANGTSLPGLDRGTPPDPTILPPDPTTDHERQP